MQKIEKNYKTLFYIFLIIGVLAYTFMDAMQKGMHQVLPEPINRHLKSMSIAISDLKYGLSGYRGYNKVLNTLVNNGITNDPSILNKYGKTFTEVLKDPVILNNAIEKTLVINNVSAAGYHYLMREDKGLIDYYKLAFKIFGYKIEGFFYLYFLLLIVSIVAFLVTFYKRVDLLNILLLFMCSHLVIVSAAPIVGIQLQTVHNARFFPVFAVLPTLYLALIILGKHRFTKGVFICTLIQTAILIFVIHIRTSARYQIVFLTMAFALASFWFWINNREAGKYIFNRIHFWPLAIILIGFFILNIHLALALQYPYTTATEKKYFWYTVYAGLAAHPDSVSKYGITYSDPAARGAVKKHLIEQYGTEVSCDPGVIESILREEFFKIFNKDPQFVIGNYLHKFPMFIKNYFSPSFGAIRYLFRPALLVIIIIGGLLAGGVALRRSLEYFCLLILGFVFSLIPSILSMPEPCLIADPALFFTIVIYFVIAGVMGYIIRILLIGKIIKRRFLSW